MSEKQVFTYLRLIIAITAFSYLVLLGLTIEEFNPLLLIVTLTCLVPDLNKLFKGVRPKNN